MPASQSYLIVASERKETRRAILLGCFCKSRPDWAGDTAGSVVTLRLPDRVAKRHGVVIEILVSYKFISKLINVTKIILEVRECQPACRSYFAKKAAPGLSALNDQAVF